MTDHAIAGFVGSFASFACVWPSEVIKYHLQQRPCRVPDVLRQVGLRGLYTGFAPAGLSVVSKNTLSFTLYRKVSETVPVPFSGVVTGAVSSIVTTPLSNMTLRMVNNPGHTRSNCMRYFYDHPLRLYTGTTANFTVDTSRIVVRFGVYDYIHATLSQYNCGVLAGGIANVCVCLVNNPIDVAMTRMQSNYTSTSSISATIQSVYTERGIKGLYAGVGIRSLRSIPGGIIMFGAYEFTMSALKGREQ